MVQHDIFGNIVPQKLCKCGCGEPVYGNVDYVLGHHARVQFSTEEGRDAVRVGVNKRWEDPEEHIKASIANKKAQGTPEARKANSKRHLQYAIDHPETGEDHSVRMKKFYSNQDNRDARRDEMNYHYSLPGSIEAAAQRTNQSYINDPDLGKRNSARKQGQDYDKGEWTGYTDKSRREYVDPVRDCHQLNNRFKGSEGHHITKSIVIFIPKELHRHIYHDIKKATNIAEMNMLAFQYMNGCYDG